MTLRATVKKRLAQGSGLIFLSDFDGTLTPIVERPEPARLSRTVRAILAGLSLHPHARVGIVSGRSLSTLKRLVRVPDAAYAGCHGLEIAWRGRRFRHPRAAALSPDLRRAARRVRREASRFRGAIVEPKGLTVGLHYRLSDPAVVPRLQSLVRDVARRAPGLEILRGKKVLELRPQIGWGKGEAVLLMRDWLARSLGRKTPVTLYLGDDRTDEEVFRALHEKIMCVAVGRRRTCAPFRLSDPAAVHTLLAWLTDTLEQAAPVRRSGERGGRGSRGGGA